MKVAIGTTSDLKIRALKYALSKSELGFEVVSVKTVSGVPDQPFGYEEIITGAKNRATSSLKATQADLAVGIENGLIEINNSYFDIPCVCIVSKEGEEFVSFGSGILIPDWIISEIKEKNIELGEVTKRLSGDSEKDPTKYFSGGKIKREEILSQAILLALVQLFNKDKYIK